MVVPPDIIQDGTSNDMMITEGGSVELKCQAKGYPVPHIHWRREDDQPITLKNKEGRKKGKLLFYFNTFILVINRMLLPVQGNANYFY